MPDSERAPVQTSTAPPRPHLLVSSLVLWGIGFVAMLVYSRQLLHTDFFFDEAWRSDIIRSSHPFATMRTIDTPIPPLWPWILHASSAIVGGRFFGLRLQGAALAALCPALIGQLVRVLDAPRQTGQVPTRGPQWARGLTRAVLATVFAAACLDGSSVATYFNDYAFQGALALAMVLVLFGIDQGWWRAWWAVPAVLAVAVGTLSGLFLLPAAAVWALRPARRQHARVVLPALAASGAVASALYLSLYRGRVDDALTSFWADDILRHGTRSVAGTFVHLVRTAGGFLYPTTDQTWTIPLGLLLLGLGAYGFAQLRQRWPWLGRMGASAWVIAAAASVVASWPVTTVRVNMPFLVLWITAAFIGVAHLFDRAVAAAPGRVTPARVTIALAAVVALFSLSSLPDQYPRTGLFAKGLDGDLQIIRASSAPHILVFGYHWMSFPYIHDGLINRHGDGGRYRTVQDSLADPLVERDVVALAEQQHRRPGDEVWCVIPIGVDGDVAERACPFDRDGYTPITTQQGRRSIIIGYRVTAAG